MGGKDNAGGLFTTVHVLNKRISEGYEHLEVKLCKERMLKLFVFRYGFHFPILVTPGFVPGSSRVFSRFCPQFAHGFGPGLVMRR